MSAPDLDLSVQRRRLVVMAGMNVLCVLIAAATAVGLFVYHLSGLMIPFLGAIALGFGAHIWFVLGFARAAGRREGV